LKASVRAVRGEAASNGNYGKNGDAVVYSHVGSCKEGGMEVGRIGRRDMVGDNMAGDNMAEANCAELKKVIG